jgi:hypothetical protein
MKGWLLFSWSFFGVLRAIKISISGHDEVLWSDPRMNLFHDAKYEHAPTVRNLASFLYSETKSSTVLIHRNYITHYCGRVSKEAIAYLIYFLGRHHQNGQITLAIVRRFLSFDCLVEGKQFRKIIKGSVLSYLAAVVSLRGSVEKLEMLPKKFQVKVLAKAHNTALTCIDLSRGSNSIVPWQPDTVFEEIKDLIFLLDGHNVRKVLPVYQDLIMRKILSPHRNLSELIIAQIYLIHYAFVMAAHHIETMEPVHIELRSVLLREDAMQRIFNSDECVCSRHVDDDADIRCHNRMAMFAKAVADLDELVRSYCGKNSKSIPLMNLSRNSKGMSAVMAIVMKNSGLILSPVMMVRLKFGLIALALTEVENYNNPPVVNLSRIFAWMREAFAISDDVPIADLRLLSTIIWDHAKHHPENAILLDLFIDYLEMTPRFCYFLLESCALDVEFKKRLQHSFKVNHFAKQIECLPKLYIRASLTNSFEMDQQFVFNSYLTLLQQSNAQSISLNIYQLEDIIQTRIFLKHFIPWFLDNFFVKINLSSKIRTYSRPRLSCNGLSLVNALRLALQASFTLGISFPEIAFHTVLNRKLQQLWVLSDSKIFDVSTFDRVILNNPLPPE